MKKLFTLGVLAAMACGAMADDASITLLKDGIYYGGYMPECVSATGKYICGSTYMYPGFVANWRTNDIFVALEQDGSHFADYGCDLPFVNDNGVAVGFDDWGPLKLDLNSRKVERFYFPGEPDCMTEDGSIVVGMFYTKIPSEFQDPHNIDYQACYATNGKVYPLPVPSEEELGYYYLGSRARCISGDGSVIMGEIIDRMATWPMILWFRQPDGTYKLDPVCMKYFSDIKYNEGYYREYVTFHGTALSNNGKWISMKLKKAPKYGEDAVAPILTGFYNVETGEITTVRINGDYGIPPESVLKVYFTGLSDNGTLVGTYETAEGTTSSFILFQRDMQPRDIADVFNTLGPLADFREPDSALLVSGISADGRYITGMGWAVDKTYDMGYYQGFVIDGGMTDTERAAVENIEADATETAREYYDLSGRRVANPEHGIFIERRSLSDGSVKSAKVIL